MPSDARSARVHLAVDNCFASKRWTRPYQWMELVRDLGLRCVEASADTEADPLYCGEDYMARWAEEVSRSGDATGVRVVNLYSGHGTYTTLGLGHTDERVRRRMLELWIKPMVRTAASLRAGLGFYCHAFDDEVLQDPGTYAAKMDELNGELAEVAAFAAAEGVTVGVEQMYSPHQYPWTIEGARDLILRVSQAGGHPLYITIDTGHQTGQRRFRRPDASTIVERASSGPAASASAPWLGSRDAQARFERCAADGRGVSSGDLAFLAEDMDRHPFLFSSPRDSDPYAWIEDLGRFSPIVHLQQVTGASSSHLPFTEANNRSGAIQPDKVLASLRASCESPVPPGFPPPPEDLYLTLEIFAGTAETPSEILAKLRESARFWRRYVPEDGLPLAELAGVPGRP
ncbi:MAG TPA: TIM barrel protein [Spirochaetia bacterium]|nr:TIM barrel protein [Spirochaetia bacterium]